MKRKLGIENCFTTIQVKYCCDVLAVRLKDRSGYYIWKNRVASVVGKVVSNEEFKKILLESEAPVVLDEYYVDISEEKRKAKE